MREQKIRVTNIVWDLDVALFQDIAYLPQELTILADRDVDVQSYLADRLLNEYGYTALRFDFATTEQ